MLNKERFFLRTEWGKGYTENTVTGNEHPRENPGYPNVEIFAQRKKDRPNHIGATIVKLVKHEKRKLIV